MPAMAGVKGVWCTALAVVTPPLDLPAAAGGGGGTPPAAAAAGRGGGGQSFSLGRNTTPLMVFG